MIGSTGSRAQPRVIVQYLEGGAPARAVPPAAAAARLRRAATVLPIADVCLGWGLPTELAEVVTATARELGAATWLWHPLLSGDGCFVPGPDRVLGASGEPVQPPGGMSEFAFDCGLRPGARAAALARLEAALDGPWDGVFLDRIRWPSPFRDPPADLGCFCTACEAAMADAGIDAGAVRAALTASDRGPDDRLRVAAMLLGREDDPVLERWLGWRCRSITDLVTEAGQLVVGRGLRLGLDAFAPSLARGVGQDLRALAPLAEFTKSMIYLGTHGPAGMAHELLGLARWLVAGGVAAPGAVLSALLGYPVPEPEVLSGGRLPVEVLEHELASLLGLAGTRGAVGVDAVRIEGLAVLDDASLVEVGRRVAGVGLPIVVSWDLWHISDARLERLATGLDGPRRLGSTVRGC